MANNTLEYIMSLQSGAFEGPMSKVRASMRGAKGDADSLNTTLGRVGAQGSSSSGIGGLVIGMGALQVATQKSEPLITRLFHAAETGIGRTARALRIGGGLTQFGAIFARQLPGMAQYRASLAATEVRAAKFNARLETLASMGGKSSGGFGMRIGMMGGQQGPAAPSPSAGVPGGGSGGGGMGIMGMLKMGALAGITAGVMGGMQASNKAAGFESTEIAFKNLIGDAALAKGTLKSLFKFAADTPFQMPEVQASAVKLQAAGVAADNLTGSLGVLGNITSAYQANLGAISTIFAQVVNKGQLYAEEIQQFGENGVPALRLLAEESGKTTAEVMAMATAGELTAADLARAFDKAGGAGGKFANAMKEQGASTAGLMGTLRDTISQVFVKLGTPINDILRPWLREAIGMAGTFGEVLQVSIDLGRQAIAKGKLGEILSASLRLGLAETLIFAGEMIGKIATGLAGALNFFTVGDLDKGTGGFVKIFSGLGDIIRAELGAAFGDVTNRFQAALTVAIGMVMEGLGNIPLLGEKLGLEGFKGPNFEDALADLQAMQGSMDDLRKQGELKIKGAFGNPAEDLKKALGEVDAGGLDKLRTALRGTVEDGAKEGLKNSLADAIGKGDGAAGKKKEGHDKSADQAEALRKDNMELDILRAKLSGRSRLVATLEREMKIRSETLRLMKEDNLTEGAALAMAKEKVALSEKLEKKTKRGSQDGGETPRSHISGFSRKAAGLADHGGLDEFNENQKLKKMGIKPGDRFEQPHGGLMKAPDAADPTDRTSTKAKQTRGFGGLDQFKGLQDMKTKGIGVGDRFKRPAGPTNLQAPGAAKAQQERREAAAQSARQERPRWDLVQEIEKHLAGLAVA